MPMPQKMGISSMNSDRIFSIRTWSSLKVFRFPLKTNGSQLIGIPSQRLAIKKMEDFPPSWQTRFSWSFARQACFQLRLARFGTAWAILPRPRLKVFRFPLRATAHSSQFARELPERVLGTFAAKSSQQECGRFSALRPYGTLAPCWDLSVKLSIAMRPFDFSKFCTVPYFYSKERIAFQFNESLSFRDIKTCMDVKDCVFLATPAGQEIELKRS